MKAELERSFAELGFTHHPDKSHVVYVDTFKRHNVKTSCTFLGYDFKLRVVKSRKTGKLLRVCMLGASSKVMKEITRTIRSWPVDKTPHCVAGSSTTASIGTETSDAGCGACSSPA